MNRNWGVTLAALGAAAAAVGCQGVAVNKAPDLSTIQLAYVCGNGFKAWRSSEGAGIALVWNVEGSTDQGSITLPALQAGQGRSEVSFSTRSMGTVILWSGETRVGSAPNGRTDCTPPPRRVQVDLSPKEAAVEGGAAQQFTAKVTGAADPAVTWTVQETVASGAIDRDGVYHATSSPGTYHVVATSNADPTASASAAVTVSWPLVQVAVSPASTTVSAQVATDFVATVTGSADGTVIWSVQEGASGGTIDAGGHYTAPSAPGTYHVVATSNANPTVSTRASVTVKVILPTVTISVSPSSATMNPQASTTFIATMTGSADAVVIWSVQEGALGGTIDAAGHYTKRVVVQ